MLRRWTIRDGDDARAGGAFQFERLAVKVTPWRVILAGVGFGAYAMGLLALLPAEVVTPAERDAVGTVWDGQLAIPGGFAAGWTVQPLASIARFGLAQGVTVMGPQTALDGQAVLRPGSVRLRDVDGVASARLLTALAPGLPFNCDADMRVDIAEMAIGGAPAGSGAIRSSAGTCVGSGGGAATQLPALDGSVATDGEATSLTLNRQAGGQAVARARISPDGALALTVEPGGVGVLPGVTAPMTIETTL